MKGKRLDKKVAGKSKFLGLLVVLAAFLWNIAIPPAHTLAQEKFPVKPINFIIGFPAGGTTDIATRSLLMAASKILGQPVIALNKPGGGMIIAAMAVKNEKGDGYTLGMTGVGLWVRQYMQKVPYDALKDYTPIMNFAQYQYALAVRSDSPWKNLKEFVEYARANPGKIRYGSSGIGTLLHLTMERLAIAEKVKWTHIPFEGGLASTTALLGGHLEATSCTPEWKKYVEAGRLRLLAVYGEKRFSDFPDVSTLRELGYDIAAVGFIGIVGPNGVPPQKVEILHQAFKKAMEDPDFINACRQCDFLVDYRNTQELAKTMADTDAEMKDLIPRLGLRKE
jgi:tripartite-type tricarboxylate transporter receptor subunit TctC